VKHGFLSGFSGGKDSEMDDKEFDSIERRSLAEQVYLHLCNSISSGKFKYGQTINTKKLSEELKVSMMPIREALKRLEMDGIVEIRPRSMCLLRKPTKKTILSAIDVRELLEVYCVKSIYSTIAESRLLELRKILDSMRIIMEKEPIDLKKYIRYDGQFHKELCDLVDNEFVSKSYKELNIHLNMNYMYDIGIKPNVSQTFIDHVDLVEALAGHSPEAIDIIEKHLKTSRKNILSGEFFATDKAGSETR
jgi:DNA-binding GntR family transcriptional regulator